MLVQRCLQFQLILNPNLSNLYSLHAYTQLCVGRTHRDSDATYEISNPGQWGDWGSWADCGKGFAVCGLRVSMEPGQGRDGDDTSMDDADVVCCPLPSTNTPSERRINSHSLHVCMHGWPVGMMPCTPRMTYWHGCKPACLRCHAHTTHTLHLKWLIGNLETRLPYPELCMRMLLHHTCTSHCAHQGLASHMHSRLLDTIHVP